MCSFNRGHKLKNETGPGAGVLREMGACGFMGTESHHGDEEEALEMGSGNGCTIMKIH